MVGAIFGVTFGALWLYAEHEILLSGSHSCLEDGSSVTLCNDNCLDLLDYVREEYSLGRGPPIWLRIFVSISAVVVILNYKKKII